MHEPELEQEGDRAARALEALRGDGHPADPLQAVPARVLGRHAPADHDRAGARAAARRSSWPTSRRPRSTCSSRRRSCEILADLRRNFDTALLLITHNLGIVAEACDRVAVMYAGRIVEQGRRARGLRQSPPHPYTRELLRSTISLATTEPELHPGRAAEPRRPAARPAGSTRAARTRWRCAPTKDPSTVSTGPAAARQSAGCTGPRTRSPPAASSRSSGRSWPLRRKHDATARHATLRARSATLEVHFALRGGASRRACTGRGGRRR